LSSIGDENVATLDVAVKLLLAMEVFETLLVKKKTSGELGVRRLGLGNGA
jgi:hypothetical protein